MPGATDVRGEARVPLVMPTDVTLAGLRAYAQGYVVDPAGAFLGLAAGSDGLRLVLAPQ